MHSPLNCTQCFQEKPPNAAPFFALPGVFRNVRSCFNTTADSATRGTIGFLLVTFFFVGNALAQETHGNEQKPKVRGAIMMANTHIPNATEGGQEVVIVPVWGIDFDYIFHRLWSVTLQADVKLQSFEIEDKSTKLQRSYPIATALVLHYHALRHWSFYAGPGYELESHQNFYLVKIGTEYGFEITEDFEIALNLMYENKEGVYDGWTFGIAFNKALWKK